MSLLELLESLMRTRNKEIDLAAQGNLRRERTGVDGGRGTGADGRVITKPCRPPAGRLREYVSGAEKVTRDFLLAENFMDG
jgi:hypothetical protein